MKSLHEIAKQVIDALRSNPPKSEEASVQINHDTTHDLAHRWINRREHESKGEADYSDEIGTGE